MAVTRVRDLYDSESGAATGKFDQKSGALSREPVSVNRRIGLWTNNAEDNVAVVLADPRVPHIGSRYPVGNKQIQAVCLRVTPKKIRPKYWEVECEYQEPPGFEWPLFDQESPQQPPEQKPPPEPEIAFGSVRREFFRHFDVDGEKIENTLGQRFEHPPAQTKYNTTITVTRFAWRYDDRDFALRRGTCNDNQFLGYAKHSVLCVDVQAKSHNWDGLWVWQVICQFEVDNDLWRPTLIANEGSLQYETDANGYRVSTKLVPTQDRNGTVHGKPVLLRADGTPLGAKEEPHMLHFNMVREADFSLFELPRDLQFPRRLE